MKTPFTFFLSFFIYNFLSAQLTEPCAPPCYKVIAGEGTATNFWESQKYAEDRLIIGGRINGQAALLTITEELKIKSYKNFETPSNDDYVRKMLIDSDGMALVTTRDTPVGETITTLFKMNPVTNEILWAKKIEIPAYFILEGFTEITPGGNYIAGGIINPAGNCNMLLTEIDRNTGDFLWGNSYDVGNCDFFEDIVIADGHVFGAGFQRVGSISQIRAGLTKMTLTGEVVWSKHYLKSFFDNARTYLTEMRANETEIVATMRGSLNDSDLNKSVGGFLKFDFDGNPILGKYYTTPDEDAFRLTEMGALGDDWILSGYYTDSQNGNQDIVVLRVDSEGEIIWAKAIGGTEGTEISGNLVVTEQGIFLVGRTDQFNTDGDALLISLTLDGSGNSENCDFIKDLEVIVNDFGSSIFAENSATNSSVAAFSLENETVELFNFEIAEESFCGELVNTELVDNTKSFNIFPNPASDQIFIEGEIDFDMKYEIFDAVGKIIQNGNLNSTIAVRNLSSGVYFLKIVSKSGNLLTQKIIIQREIERP